MKNKVIILSIVLVIAFAATMFLLFHDSNNAGTIRPEVLHVTASEATVAWRSGEPSPGKVFFEKVHGREAVSAVDDETTGNIHEVVLRGLGPETRYRYRPGTRGPWFEFRTQPLLSSTFSFLIVRGGTSETLRSVLRSEMPDFFFMIGDNEAIGTVRPYCPVFDFGGVNSPHLGKNSKSDNRTISWGGFQLLVINHIDKPFLELLSGNAHTTGVILCKEAEPAAIHEQLKEYNLKNPENRIAFVLSPSTGANRMIDKISYVSLPPEVDFAARVDIGVESSRVVFLESNRGEIALRKPTEKQKLTCTECRRLADRGAFEESIKAYKSFIEEHEKHYQVDDAYYAVAEILDEKLFRYREAIEWYGKLIKKHSQSPLVAIAKQRIEYLNKHSDHDFKPLASFERIRRVEWARSQHDQAARDRCLNSVSAILKEYPRCTAAAAMNYWLANQYRRIDTGRAIELYRQLLAEYPDSPFSRNAWLEMGEAWYDAGEYKKAAEIFEEALQKDSANHNEIQTQLGRANRNIRREYLATASWCTIAAILFLALTIPPLGLRSGNWPLAIFATTVVGLAIVSGGWLIHEQFDSNAELFIFAFGFAASAGIGLPLSINAAGFIKNPRGRLPVQIVFGLVLMTAGFYLITYYTNVHYLTAVGL